MSKKGKILQISNLNMRFGGIKALSDVSFDITENSITALIGPNGAGKTTVFNCCTGFYMPNSGDVLFNTEYKTYNVLSLVGQRLVWRDTTKPLQLARKIYSNIFGGSFLVNRVGIARTFQNPRLFKGMTVIENLLVAQHHKLNRNIFSGVLNTKSYKTKQKQAIDDAYFWLEKMGLADQAQHMANSLSYGQTRKLELARSMCTNPKIICLDEPAAGLNNKETAELSQIVIDLKDTFGITVFLIEHDMRMVMAISEKIIVLDHGVVIAEGTAKEIQNNPAVIESYLGIDDGEDI